MKIDDTIYLDHQASTPTDPRVFEAIKPYFLTKFGNPHSSDHIYGWQSAKAVDDAAAKVAYMLGGDADEVIFTSGATESNNLALLGLAHGNADTKRNRVLVSAIEHKSVLASAKALQDQLGLKIETIPVDSDGTIILSALEEALDAHVLLVSTILVNHEIGSIQPLNEISKLCAAHGTLLHCDATQAPIAMDMQQISEQSDLISLSAHKIYGPKGLGALFVRRDIQNKLAPIIHGGGQQNHLRSGTMPTPLCVGMGIAAELLTGESAQDEREALSKLRDRLIAGLENLEYPIHLNGPPLSNRHPGNANIRFEGFAAQDILGALQPKIAASTGSACTTGMPEPSYILTAIGLPAAEAESSIRFSPGRYTTEEDIDEAVTLIQQALDNLSREGLQIRQTI